MSPNQVFLIFRQDRFGVVSGVPPGSLSEVIWGAKSCSWELKSRNLAAQGSHLAAYAIYAVFAAYCCPRHGYRNPEPMPRGGSNHDPWPQQTKDLLLGLRPRPLDIDLSP